MFMIYIFFVFLGISLPQISISLANYDLISFIGTIKFRSFTKVFNKLKLNLFSPIAENFKLETQFLSIQSHLFIPFKRIKFNRAKTNLINQVQFTNF